MFINQAQLLEQAQAPVHRGQADRRIGAAGTTVQFLGVNMPAGVAYQLQEQSSLRGERVSCYCLVQIANVSHSQLILYCDSASVSIDLRYGPVSVLSWVFAGHDDDEPGSDAETSLWRFRTGYFVRPFKEG